MYETAGEDVTLQIPLLVEGDFVVPDIGSVTYTVRDGAGQPITGLIDVAVTTDDATTSIEITVLAAKNAITADIEQRTVTVKFVSGGAGRRIQIIYKLTDWLNMSATPGDVRSVIGCNGSELADQDIDLVLAYFQSDALLGGTILADELAGGGLASLNANRIIILRAALQVIPSLQLRIAQSETNGVVKYNRIAKLDFAALQAALAGQLADLIADLTGIPVSVGSLFILSSGLDPITGA